MKSGKHGPAATLLRPFFRLPVRLLICALYMIGARKAAFTAKPSWLAHGLPRQLDMISVMHQAVADGIRKDGVSHHLMPGGHGVLAGHEGGAGPAPVLQDLHEQAGLVVAQLLDPPVICFSSSRIPYRHQVKIPVFSKGNSLFSSSRGIIILSGSSGPGS